MRIFYLIIAISTLVIIPRRQLNNDEVIETHFTIDSKILSEKISVTTYRTIQDVEPTSIVYITDGQKMIANGALDRIKQLTTRGKIPNAYYVFVSTIDPATNEDKRNTYFFCNNDYVRFFEEELIPRVEGSLSYLDTAQYKLQGTPEQRSLVGISFGGLSAAYFSGKTDIFKNYALLSPITYPCKDALSSIAFSEKKDLNIFISTGKNDAENYVGSLIQLYTSKGYRIENLKTEGAHDFENWNSQLEEVLHFLNNH